MKGRHDGLVWRRGGGRRLVRKGRGGGRIVLRGDSCGKGDRTLIEV